MLFSPTLITFVVVSALYPAGSVSSYLDINSYPNPQRFNGYSTCRLDRRGTLCDPEGVLGNETEHAELIRMLDNFPNITQNALGQTSCKRKGVTVGIALSKQHIVVKETKTRTKKNEYSEEREPEEERYDEYFTGMIVAEKLADMWQLDEDCRKVVIILYPADEHMDSVTLFSYKNVPILEEEKAHLLAMESGLLKAHKHFAALKALLAGLRQIIVHRQELFSSIDDDLPSPPPAACPFSSHLSIILICILIALCLAIAVPPTISLAINRFMAKRRRSAGHQHIVEGPLVTAAGLNLISNVD